MYFVMLLYIIRIIFPLHIHPIYTRKILFPKLLLLSFPYLYLYLSLYFFCLLFFLSARLTNNIFLFLPHTPISSSTNCHHTNPYIQPTPHPHTHIRIHVYRHTQRQQRQWKTHTHHPPQQQLRKIRRFKTLS